MKCGEVAFKEKELLIKGQRTSEHKNRKKQGKKELQQGMEKQKNMETSRIKKNNFDLRNPIHIIYLCTSVSYLNFKRRIKSLLPFAGIVRSSQYSPRFQVKG